MHRCNATVASSIFKRLSTALMHGMQCSVVSSIFKRLLCHGSRVARACGCCSTLCKACLHHTLALICEQNLGTLLSVPPSLSSTYAVSAALIGATTQLLRQVHHREFLTFLLNSMTVQKRKAIQTRRKRPAWRCLPWTRPFQQLPLSTGPFRQPVISKRPSWVRPLSGCHHLPCKRLS